QNDSQPSSVFTIQSSSTNSTTDAVTSTPTHDFLQHLNINDTDLTEADLGQLKTLLMKYHICFRDTPGRTSLAQHHIDIGSAKPIKLRPYRVSPQRQQVISKHIRQMLLDDIIEPANGPFAAPVTLQSKKDGSLRFCVDFRQLNSV